MISPSEKMKEKARIFWVNILFKKICVTSLKNNYNFQTHELQYSRQLFEINRCSFFLRKVWKKQHDKQLCKTISGYIYVLDGKRKNIVKKQIGIWK